METTLSGEHCCVQSLCCSSHNVVVWIHHLINHCSLGKEFYRDVYVNTSSLMVVHLESYLLVFIVGVYLMVVKAPFLPVDWVPHADCTCLVSKVRLKGWWPLQFYEGGRT